MNFPPSIGSAEPAVLPPHAPLPRYYGSEAEHLAVARIQIQGSLIGGERVPPTSLPAVNSGEVIKDVGVIGRGCHRRGDTSQHLEPAEVLS